VGWKSTHEKQSGGGLKGRKPAFTYTASPRRLTVLESGEVIPVIGMITHEKGLDGCRSTGPGPDDVEEGGAITNATVISRLIIVPHDIKVRAFGEERVGYLGHTIGTLQQQPYRGSDGDWWADAWTRLTWDYEDPVWEIDADGYLDFHRRVLKYICPQGLSDAQIKRAERISGNTAGPKGKPRSKSKEA